MSANPSTCPRCGSTHPQPDGFCPRCACDDALNSPAGDEFDPDYIDKLPMPGETRVIADKYTILETIARGGMGVVYKARQENLNRIVALKMLLGGIHASEDYKRRFLQEAKSAAKLNHPNIVAIDDWGEDSGQPYFSMDYIEGKTLAEMAREQPLPARTAAEIVRTLAGAMHYAHSQGVLHRDLKPSNVLVNAEGVPRLTDFGLARQMGEGTQLTGSGQFLGTPGFLPPEQASANAGAIGPASDVYGLGAILYFLLTGRAPFVAETVEEMLRQLFQAEPISPRLLNPSVLRDLETICLKCLEKDPRRRYATARVVAEELERFLRGEPIEANPVGPVEKAWRWCRRHPTVSGLAAAVVALLVTVAAVATVAAVWIAAAGVAERSQGQQAVRERDRAERSAKEAIVQRAAAETASQHAQEASLKLADTLSRTQMRYAENLFSADSSAAALAYLANVLRQNPENRVAAQRIVTALSQRTFPTLLTEPMRPGGYVRCVQFSPDGRRIVIAGQSSTVQIWDAVTGVTVGQPFQHRGAVHYAEFSPDGARVVTASKDATACVWDAGSGQRITPWLQHRDEVWSARFSPDGSHVVTASRDGSAGIWDATSGKAVSKPLTHKGEVHSAEFSPDGTKVVTASADKTASIWDVRTGSLLTNVAHDGEVRVARFSPDGGLILTASDDKTAQLWDAATGEAIGSPFLHEKRVRHAAFSPDGQKVVTASDDKTARVWDSYKGLPLTAPLQHGRHMRFFGAVLYAEFSPDGERLVTTSDDRVARVWDTRTGAPLTEPMLHADIVHVARFSPDGQRIATASSDQAARIWDISLRRLLPLLCRHDAEVTAAEFSPDGRLVLTASKDKLVRFWNPKSGDETGSALKHTTSVRGAQFSPGGKLVVTLSGGTTAQVWDIATGKRLGERMSHQAQVVTACFDGAGTRVVTASMDYTARVWDARTGSRITESLRHNGIVHGAVFNPTGDKVATVSADHTACVWDAQSGRLLAGPVAHHGDIYSICFSPDGRSFLTASQNQTAQLFDTLSGKPLGPAFRHDWSVLEASFNTDGSRVVTASEDYTARVWDVATGAMVSETLPHQGWVRSARFDLSGDRIVTSSRDGTARVWDAQTGLPLTDPIPHPGEVKAARFSPDGKSIVTASTDSAARIWDLLVMDERPPIWLADLAEALGGSRIIDQSIIESTPSDELNRLRAKLAHIAGEDFYTRWVRWLLGPRTERTITPYSTIMVDEYVLRQIDDTSLPGLLEATRLAPTNALALGRLARGLIVPVALQDSRRLGEAQHLSQRALTLAPELAELWEIRALTLASQNGRESNALAFIEQASFKFPQNPAIWSAKGRLLESAGKTEEARRAIIKAGLLRLAASGEIQPRPPTAPPQLIDLSLHYNAALADTGGWHDRPKNNLSTLPSGLRTHAGVQFDVRGIVQLSAQPLKAHRRGYPDRVLDIKVSRNCSRLHFLHGAGWGTSSGVEIGAFVIHYSDGQAVTSPIVYGEDVVCFWGYLDHDDLPKRAALAWKEMGPENEINLFKSTWENPRPDVEIVSLDYVSSMKKVAPFLIAITAE